MRTITVVLLALLAMALTGTSANAGSWCANYLRGVSNCGYSSAAQCWATVCGLGDGFCAPTPYPGTAYGSGGSSGIAQIATGQHADDELASPNTSALAHSASTALSAGLSHLHSP